MAIIDEVEFVGAASANYDEGRSGHKAICVVHHVALGDFDSIRDFFLLPHANPSSAHFSIAPDGRIRQHVNLKNSAYGQGRIRNPNYNALPWLRDVVRGGMDANDFCIAIEYAGRHRGGKGGYVTYQDRQVWIDLLPGTVQEFYTPTAAQIQAGIALDRWLLEYIGQQPARDVLARHSDFDGVGKWFCPSGEWHQKQKAARLTLGGFPMLRVLHELGVAGY